MNRSRIAFVFSGLPQLLRRRAYRIPPSHQHHALHVLFPCQIFVFFYFDGPEFIQIGRLNSHSDKNALVSLVTRQTFRPRAFILFPHANTWAECERVTSFATKRDITYSFALKCPRVSLWLWTKREQHMTRWAKWKSTLNASGMRSYECPRWGGRERWIKIPNDAAVDGAEWRIPIRYAQTEFRPFHISYPAVNT